MKVDVKQIDPRSVCVDGVDMADYPDLVDAFISEASYMDGTELTEDELQALPHDYVWEQVWEAIH
jgi:hypothetical protein